MILNGENGDEVDESARFNRSEQLCHEDADYDVEIDLSDIFDKSQDPSISSHKIKVPHHLVREWERNEREYQAFIYRMKSMPQRQAIKTQTTTVAETSTATIRKNYNN